jgi:tRNA (adenine37-N6)-methyltransferase
MNIFDTVLISPIGYVENSEPDREKMPPGGRSAVIRLLTEYRPALLRIGEHSHLWVLSWLHQADRSLLRVRPSKINPGLAEFGVFALRTAPRPNPIGLTLVRLVKTDKYSLTVDGLDVVDGTPVMDIKPYFEFDVVFSPATPHIMPRDRQVREKQLYQQGLNHHGEVCSFLALAVKMVLAAEERLGPVRSPEVRLTVTGDPCLADLLQGLSGARLANPARFTYAFSPGKAEVLWVKGKKSLRLVGGNNPAGDRDAALEVYYEDGDGPSKGGR